MIPKSVKIPEPNLPKTKAEFFNFFRANPLEAIQLGPRFVPQMDPRDLVRTLRLIASSSSLPCAELEEAVVKRTEEIGCNFTLSELLIIARHFGGLDSKRLSSFFPSLLNPHLQSSQSLRTIKNSDLIFLIPTKSDFVADELIRRRDFSAYEIATIANAYKKHSHQPRVLFNHLSKLFISIEDEKITARDLSLIANALTFSDSQLVEKIQFCAIGRINDFTPQGLAVLAHAFAKSDQLSSYPALVSGIVHRSLNTNLDPHSMGLLLYAFGKEEIRVEKFTSHMAELVKRKVQTFSFRSLAMACYGFSRLGVTGDKDLWRLIADELVYRWTEKRNSKIVKTATPADIAMIAKAFSRLGKTGSEIIDSKLGFVLFKFLKRTSVNKENLSPSTVVEVLDAFTRLPRVGGSVEVWGSKRVPELLDRMNSQQLVSVITAGERLGISSKFFQSKLAKIADIKITDPVLRTVAAVRLAKLHIYDESFARTTVKILSANLGSLDFRALVNALFAFSEMNHRDQLFVSRVIQALRHQLSNMSCVEAKHLSTLAISASRLRVGDESFYDDLLAKIYLNIEKFDCEQSICNTLFALATALGSGDFKDSSGWFVPVTNALIHRLSRDVTVEGVRQLQILSLALKLKNIKLDDLRSDEMLKKVDSVNTFASNAPSLEQSSSVHREVSKLLTVLGLEHRNEATVGPFSLDIYVPDSNVVVEIDGPHHFFRESSTRTSSSVLKHLILESIGYRVMHVPFHEWLQCSSETKKIAYCSDLVNKIKIQAS